MKKIILTIILLGIVLSCYLFINYREVKMIDLSNMSIKKINKYALKYQLNLTIEKEYSNTIDKDKIISQSIEKGKKINKNDKLIVVISLGINNTENYKKYMVNELGSIPIMMYHNIVNAPNNTNFIGGNLDKNGYSRTVSAFRNDLEFYYKNGYRMIRLVDYINGNIDTALGKSPIIFTFDDGNKNNINIIGTDDKGNLMIDPNSAVGILEEFKKKYPDFNVTATFFLNSELFGQPNYDNKILKWLIDNGYDIGNHTKNHVDFRNIDISETQLEVGYIYKLFDSIIPNKYVHIVSLPYGSPNKKEHPNFSYILSGNYDGYNYKTDSTLQVGWDAECSPFSKYFDKTFLKRVRAWDNNGNDFDIQMVFDRLSGNHYVSDGDSSKIVISDDKNLNLDIKDKKVIKY